MQALTYDWNNIPQEEISAALNSIDGQFQRVMTNAEKKRRKLRVGAIERSLELSKLGLRWNFWRKALHNDQGRFGNTVCMQSTAKYLQINSCNMPLASSIDRLNTARL